MYCIKDYGLSEYHASLVHYNVFIEFTSEIRLDTHVSILEHEKSKYLAFHAFPKFLSCLYSKYEKKTSKTERARRKFAMFFELFHLEFQGN